MAIYEDMSELIRLGAYRRGSDQQVDEAIFYHDALEKFLSQEIGEATDLDGCYVALADILGLAIQPASSPAVNVGNAAAVPSQPQTKEVSE